VCLAFKRPQAIVESFSYKMISNAIGDLLLDEGSPFILPQQSENGCHQHLDGGGGFSLSCSLLLRESRTQKFNPVVLLLQTNVRQ
jgi:hypothetical protein